MFLLPASSLPQKKARRHARSLYLGTALVLVSSSAFAQDKGLEAFNAYMDGLKRFGMTIENGLVDYDPGSDTLTLTDSTLSFGGMIQDLTAKETDDTGADGTTETDQPKPSTLSFKVSFSSGTVTISGLTHDGNRFSAENWVYSDDTKMLLSGSVSGKGRLKAETRFAGMSATRYDFVLPDLPPDNPAQQASRWLPFVKAALLTSFDDVKVDNSGTTLEAYDTSGDKEKLVMSSTIQMDGYHMSGARDGLIAEYSIDRMVQNMKTLDAPSGQMLAQTTSQGKTVYSNIDIGALLDLFDPSVSETGEERTLVGSGTAVDYVSDQEIANGLSIKATAETATIDKVSVIKRDNSVLGLIDDVLNKKTPTPEELLVNLFQFYRSFAVADARVSGVSLIVPIAPGLDSAITIKEMAMTNVGASGVEEMMLVGLNAPALPKDASVKLDWAAIGGIEFADYAPMEGVIQKMIADSTYAQKNPLEVARTFLPRSFGYEIEGLDVTVPDTGRVQIGKAEMTLFSTVPPIPTSFHQKSEGVHVPVAALDDPEARALLTALGLDTLVWSDETRLYWDEATKELNLERLGINVEGLGTVEASAKFANVPRALFEDPQGQGQLAAITAQFVTASFTFQDAGFTSKGLKHAAETQGIPEDALREALVAQAGQATAPIQNPAFTKMVSDAVKTYLDDPKSLKVTLAPANPVPLAQILGSMAAPQGLPDLLNVKVVAN